MSEQHNPPVLIIGAGPVGQLAALLLSAHGIRTTLIDRRETLSSAPKAHAVNPRTLEICDQIGISAARLRTLGASANDGGDVRFVGTLTGPEFGSLPYERQDDATFAATPFPLSNIPQPVFEAELLARINVDKNITLQRGVEASLLNDNGSSVDVTLRSVSSGATALEQFTYVLAADGAGSRTRESLGIEMAGPESLQDFLMIHFSADLRPFTKDRRGVLYFLFAPGVSGTLIAYDQARTWVLMHPVNKAKEQLDDYTPARCRTLIEQAIGAPVADLSVENLSPWTMTAQIAQHYRAGRVFLIGDAAHRFPPAGGLGLNTGAGDAQNICWKLAAVIRGAAGDALLDSYETERQPIAHINSEQSMMNSAKLFDLYAAIHGPDPETSAAHYAAVATDPAAFPELTRAVAAQRPHFDSFNLQLGYRYHSAAIHEPADIPLIRDVSDYQPSWDNGAHFPHCWVTTPEGQQPLQDYFSASQFSLFMGPAAESPPMGEELAIVRFGTDVSIDADWTALTALPAAGALLIRPDGHIAARFDALSDDTLQTILNTILFRES